MFTVYTDGSCLGNPGPGGWAVLCLSDNCLEEFFGFEPLTTNNRMELMAAIRGLMATPEKSNVMLYTDSKYVQQGMTAWILNWKKNGWRSSTGKTVQNIDLWKELDILHAQRIVNFQWIRAHNAHPQNERVDQLARMAATKQVTCWKGDL